MQVMILHTDDGLGIKQGEIYEAEAYRLDPYEKVSLLRRVPDGYEPNCNQYRHEVAKKIKGVWHEVSEEGHLVPTDVKQRGLCKTG